MSKASTESEPPLASGKGRVAVEVDPAILAVIESASVPIGVPKNVVPPASIPGSVGHLQGALGVVDILRRGIDAVLDYRAKHGDVCRTSIAGNPMVAIWDADAIQRILKNEDKAWSTGMGWAKYMFEGLDDRGSVGGLLAMDFEDHRIARKLVAPAFTTKAIDGYLLTAGQRFASVNEAWVARGRVRFKAEARTLLARVANEIFIGIQDPRRIDVIDRALTDFWSSQLAFVKSPWLSPTFRRGKRGLKTLLAMVIALVPERRAAGGSDLLSQLCSVTDRDDLDDEDIARIFISILGAAFDSVSAGLTSMAYLLAKHPEWQQRLRDEALAVGDRPLDTTSARSMKSCELVWKETLRLFPVAPFVPRRPLRAVDVGGHTLPAGTLALIATGAMGRHPAWWTNPNGFDPERFSADRAEDRKHPGIYNPFGSGPHACIGMQLTTLEVKAFWHDLLRRCHFRLSKNYAARHAMAPLGTVSGDVELTLEPLTA